MLDIGKSYAALFLVRLLGLGVTTGEVERVALYFGLYLDKRGMLITDTMFESVLNEGDEHQGRDHQVPVLYYPLDSWFIKSTAKKERMSELNKTINWQPESTGTGRFGNWLDNLNDWNLSRSRFWGTPLPIWRSEDGEEICIGSVEELYNEMEKAVKAGVMKSNLLKDQGFVPGDMSQANYDKIDLHRPYVDYIVLVSESGKPMKRESDLIDVWFDSGSMPYAQVHYPFENRDLIDKGIAFPCDFINEGVDRGIL